MDYKVQSEGRLSKKLKQVTKNKKPKEKLKKQFKSFVRNGNLCNSLDSSSLKSRKSLIFSTPDKFAGTNDIEMPFLNNNFNNSMCNKDTTPCKETFTSQTLNNLLSPQSFEPNLNSTPIQKNPADITIDCEDAINLTDLSNLPNTCENQKLTRFMSWPSLNSTFFQIYFLLFEYMKKGITFIKTKYGNWQLSSSYSFENEDPQLLILKEILQKLNEINSNISELKNQQHNSNYNPTSSVNSNYQSHEAYHKNSTRMLLKEDNNNFVKNKSASLDLKIKQNSKDNLKQSQQLLIHEITGNIDDLLKSQKAFKSNVINNQPPEIFVNDNVFDNNVEMCDINSKSIDQNDDNFIKNGIFDHLEADMCMLNDSFLASDKSSVQSETNRSLRNSETPPGRPVFRLKFDKFDNDFEKAYSDCDNYHNDLVFNCNFDKTRARSTNDVLIMKTPEKELVLKNHLLKMCSKRPYKSVPRVHRNKMINLNKNF